MFNKSKTANAVRTLFVGRSNKNKHSSAVAKWAYSTEVQQVKQKKPKEKLIILGGGWAGFRIIKDIDLEKYEVSVVSPRNHFLFTPLLPSTMSGTLEFRSIIEPIRRARAHQDYHYYESHCEGIDTEKKLVYCNPNHVDDKPFTLTYDKLIVCVGCDVNSFGIKGVKEHAYFLKELTDARKLRGKIIECFERAANPNTPIYMREKLLHFVIVGAGPTGVEAAAELQDLIDQDLKKIFPEHIHLDVKITILEAGNNILSMFDSGLQRYTQRFFYRKKIQIYMGAKVSEVKSENLVVLADGSEIECGFVLWSAGIQPRHVVWHKNQAVASQAIAAAAEKSEATPTTVVTATALAVEDKQLHNLPLEQRTHRILVDDHLQVKGTPNVFAIGDCSFVESKPMAQTAQVAQQQAKYLVNMLNTIAKAEDSSVASAVPFVYHHQGTMAYLGGFRAISQLVSGRFGISLQGLIAFLFYRSAYLTKLVSIKNKILVPADWLKTLLFGRDVSRF